MELKTGLTGHKEMTVRENMLATALGSGTQPVFGTPFMLALMEGTCYESVQDFLAPGQATVGTGCNISHVSATPLGMRVWCESTLMAVDRRKLTFSVVAYDESGLIGQGTHERFIIDTEKFLAKANAKKPQEL